MKKLYFILILSLLAVSLFAQAPQKMSYQAVVRNSNNALVTEQNVSVRLSILQGSATGAAVYTETHTATTNVNGLLTVEVGGGNSSQNFSQIPWGNGPFYLKSEIDPNGGINYSIESVQQLLSVPYALYAGSAGNVPAFAVTPTDTGYVLVLTLPNGTVQSYVLRNGQQGPQGPAGPQGPQGQQGQPGPAGANGTNGTDGISPIVTTTSTATGTQVTVTDANGPHTFTILNGTNGTNGQNGQDGRGILTITGPVSSGLNDTYTINFTDGTSTNFVVHNGAAGATGATGPAGPTGAPGAAGANGRGITSISGPVSSGLNDTYTINYSDGSTSTFTVHNGANGTNGTNGTNGADGQDGFSPIVTTASSSLGTVVTITDADGPHTFTIHNGAQGPAGTNGTNGQDGISPTVATFTAGDSTVVTITDANGPHSFTLHNGQQGPQGLQGPQGNPGANGTNGTNGTNGQDGRGIQDEGLMRAAMERIAAAGSMIVEHCEVNELLRGGYIHDGLYARQHGHRGIC